MASFWIRFDVVSIHIFIKYLGPSWIIGVEKVANKTKKDPIFKPFLAYLQHRNKT